MRGDRGERGEGGERRGGTERDTHGEMERGVVITACMEAAVCQRQTHSLGHGIDIHLNLKDKQVVT